MTLNKAKIDTINSKKYANGKIELVNGIHGTCVCWDRVPICTLDEVTCLFEELARLKTVVEEETGLVL